MIVRLARVSMAFFLALISLVSCTAPAKKEPAAEVKDSLSLSDPVSVILPFTADDAESLAGKYYNQENQLKKYAYYNSMAINEIKIDSNYQKDTILVTAHTSGRIWPNPNKDTTTSFFSRDLVLKVYRHKQIWWADKLQAPESVNAIPKPVKK